jgi:hypothetical protein
MRHEALEEAFDEAQMGSKRGDRVMMTGVRFGFGTRRQVMRIRKNHYLFLPTN